jgi:hypothetical protein
VALPLPGSLTVRYLFRGLTVTAVLRVTGMNLVMQFSFCQIQMSLVESRLVRFRNRHLPYIYLYQNLAFIPLDLQPFQITFLGGDAVLSYIEYSGMC